MDQYQPQIQWEITRAAVSIAAWWVLFYRLHRPESLWRRIVLLVAMPTAYAFWILMPMSIVANAACQLDTHHYPAHNSVGSSDLLHPCR